MLYLIACQPVAGGQLREGSLGSCGTFVVESLSVRGLTLIDHPDGPSRASNQACGLFSSALGPGVDLVVYTHLTISSVRMTGSMKMQHWHPTLRQPS